MAKKCWEHALESEPKYADVDEFELEFAPAEPFMDAVHEVAALT